MKTFLAQNQFLNPSVISPRTEGSAVAFSDPSGSDATAAPIHSSDGGGEQTTTPADASLTMEPMGGCDTIEAPSKAGTVPSPSGAIPMTMEVPSEASAPAPTKNPDADALGTDHIRYPLSDGRRQSLADGTPELEAGLTCGSTLGLPDSSGTEGAVSTSTASSDISHIHEIFHYVRKLMKQPPRFVLDEESFMAEVEETPLFIRSDGYLKRQA